MQILALVVLSFYHFEGSFHFWAHLWGLVLRPFSTCSSLMSFSLFFTFLVASFSSGCFFFFFFSFFSFSFFCSLLSRASYGSFLSSVCEFFVVFCCWAVFHPALSLLVCSHQFAELGSSHCLAFSARACSLAFLFLAILSLAICWAVFGYTDLFF